MGRVFPGRRGYHLNNAYGHDGLKRSKLQGSYSNLSDKIPQYTAADLTRIPFVNADSTNVLAMAKKIDTLEQRLNSLEQLLTQSRSQSHLSSSVNNEASTSCYEQGDQHTDAVNAARDIHVIACGPVCDNCPSAVLCFGHC